MAASRSSWMNSFHNPWWKTLDEDSKFNFESKQILYLDYDLRVAVEAGNLNRFAQIIGEKTAELSQVSRNEGKSLLHLAVEHDHANILDYLLKLGCKADVRNRDGLFPIHLAAAKANPSCLRRLLEEKAAVIGLNEVTDHCEADKRRSALRIAAKVGGIQTLRMLLNDDRVKVKDALERLLFDVISGLSVEEGLRKRKVEMILDTLPTRYHERLIHGDGFWTVPILAATSRAIFLKEHSDERTQIVKLLMERGCRVETYDNEEVINRHRSVLDRCVVLRDTKTFVAFLLAGVNYRWSNCWRRRHSNESDGENAALFKNLIVIMKEHEEAKNPDSLRAAVRRAFLSQTYHIQNWASFIQSLDIPQTLKTYLSVL